MKKLFALLIAGLISALSAALCVSADTALHEGDIVEYVFVVSECDNAAGMAAVISYNDKYIAPEDVTFPSGGQGMFDIETEGTVKWNLMFGGGREFSEDTAANVKFTVITDCSLEDADLSFELTELFSHDLIQLPRSIITGKIYINGDEYISSDNMGGNMESDTQNDKDNDTSGDASSETGADSSEPQNISDNDTSTYSHAEGGSESRINRPQHVEITTSDLTNSEDMEDLPSRAVRASESTRSTAPKNEAAVSRIDESISKTSDSASDTSGSDHHKTDPRSSDAADESSVISESSAASETPDTAAVSSESAAYFEPSTTPHSGRSAVYGGLAAGMICIITVGAILLIKNRRGRV